MAMNVSLEPDKLPLRSAEFGLGEQIARITQEKGSFASLKEDVLAREIEELPDATADLPEPEPEPESEETSGAGTFEQARTSLLARVHAALNESALSLDFVSLLVSSLKPQSGASSMSPMLKSQVPIGTVGADTVTEEATKALESKAGGPVPEPGPGWKLTAFSQASKQLAEAGARLKTETQREDKFWDQLLDTVLSGEYIVKNSRGKMRGLNIKYGFGDSGSTYFDRGIGAISRSDDGDMVFVPSRQPLKRVVRVALWSADNRLLGFGAHSVQGSSEIGVARDYLFEEELFYLLIQEARSLAAHRVALVDNHIVCELYDKVLEIEFVDENHLGITSSTRASSVAVSEEGSPSEDTKTVAGEENTEAGMICAAMHLLLCHHHDKTLAHQHAEPEPRNSKKRIEPETKPVLGPILAHMQHATAAARALRLVDMMVADAKVDVVPKPDTEGVLDVLLSSPETTYVVHAPNGDITLTVGSPLDESKATFRTKSKGSEAGFYDLTELDVWLRWAISN